MNRTRAITAISAVLLVALIAVLIGAQASPRVPVDFAAASDHATATNSPIASPTPPDHHGSPLPAASPATTPAPHNTVVIAPIDRTATQFALNLRATYSAPTATP